MNPLSFFHIGDRVLVCNSRPGVLKYKGPTTFAGGFWAGVELDTPRGNHNGTFRGVKYFTCKKNHGVLVRAEDVTHPSREWCSYLNTGAHQESFSDEDPPNGQNGTNGNRPSRPSGNRQGIKKDSQTNPAHDPSAQKQICHQEPCENDATRDSSNELSSCSRSSEKSPLKVSHSNKLATPQKLPGYSIPTSCYTPQQQQPINTTQSTWDTIEITEHPNSY
uniref:CAP-Gly domain-containing protein n=1 Tax=Astyanax mexicanus TaxID=7994 RepID=A0A8B9J806_ASTMX